MKNLVAIIIILSCLAGGILFYLKGCSPGPVPDRRPVDSILALQRSQDSAAAIKIDSLTRLDSWHRHREDSLTAALKDKRAQLNAKAAAYRELVARGDDAAARRDTVAALANADTMREQAREGLPVIREYIDLSDSTVREYEARMAIKDSIIVTWADLSRHKDTTISILRTNYNKVYADDVKRIKWDRLWKPVAIGGVAYVIGTIVMQALKK